MTESMSEWPTGRLLSTSARLVEHAWGDALESIGLTHAGLIVLHLLESAAASQAELARGARVEEQTMSRTIERLERQGFIERQRDPRDRRRYLVASTEAGRAVFAQSRSIEADLFPLVTHDEQFRRSLLEIIRAASERRWQG